MGREWRRVTDREGQLWYVTRSERGKRKEIEEEAAMRTQDHLLTTCGGAGSTLTHKDMFVAWAVLFLSCVTPPPVEAPVYLDVPPLNPIQGTFEYHGDVTFKLEERYLIDAATASVEELTRASVRMSVVAWDWRLDDPQAPWVRRVVRIPLEAAWTLDAECGQKLVGCTEAWGRSSSDEVALVPDRVRSGLYPVVRHELGHQIGMVDLDPWVEGVMNPYHIADAWTEADVKECRRVRRCP